MIAIEPFERGGVDAVSADSTPSGGSVELERRARIHFDVDAAAAGDAPGFVERKGTGEIDRAANFFEIERAADAAEARVAADKADRDFARDIVSRELAADFADLQAARQVRGAHPAADHAGFDVGRIFDFQMSADHARDERRVHAEQVGAAGDLFDRHFAVDRAAIEARRRRG